MMTAVCYNLWYVRTWHESQLPVHAAAYERLKTAAMRAAIATIYRHVYIPRVGGGVGGWMGEPAAEAIHPTVKQPTANQPHEVAMQRHCTTRTSQNCKGIVIDGPR